MAKEFKNYDGNFKKQSILMYIIILLVLFSCILSLVNACAKNKEEKSDYDVTMMRTVGVQDVLDLFNDKKTYVLYIGRETCDVCVDLLPTLQQAQIDNNYITQYLDITKVDFSSNLWKTLAEKLDVETTTTITNDGENKQVTNTFGYFLDLKGFTPCMIIIKDGRQVAGFFGNQDLTTFEDWLHEYGI